MGLRRCDKSDKCDKSPIIKLLAFQHFLNIKKFKKIQTQKNNKTRTNIVASVYDPSHKKMDCVSAHELYLLIFINLLQGIHGEHR